MKSYTVQAIVHLNIDVDIAGTNEERAVANARALLEAQHPAAALVDVIGVEVAK